MRLTPLTLTVLPVPTFLSLKVAVLLVMLRFRLSPAIAPPRLAEAVLAVATVVPS